MDCWLKPATSNHSKNFDSKISVTPRGNKGFVVICLVTIKKLAVMNVVLIIHMITALLQNYFFSQANKNVSSFAEFNFRTLASFRLPIVLAPLLARESR